MTKKILHKTVLTEEGKIVYGPNATLTCHLQSFAAPPPGKCDYPRGTCTYTGDSCPPNWERCPQHDIDCPLETNHCCCPVQATETPVTNKFVLKSNCICGWVDLRQIEQHTNTIKSKTNYIFALKLDRKSKKDGKSFDPCGSKID